MWNKILTVFQILLPETYKHSPKRETAQAVLFLMIQIISFHCYSKFYFIAIEMPDCIIHFWQKRWKNRKGCHWYIFIHVPLNPARTRFCNISNCQEIIIFPPAVNSQSNFESHNLQHNLNSRFIQKWFPFILTHTAYSNDFVFAIWMTKN